MADIKTITLPDGSTYNVKDANAVPSTRKINEKALSSDITLSMTDLTNDAGFLTDVTYNTTTVNSITAVGTLPSLTTTVNNKVLTIGWSAGSLPTKGSNTTVLTGITPSASLNNADVTSY